MRVVFLADCDKGSTCLQIVNVCVSVSVCLPACLPVCLAQKFQWSVKYRQDTKHWWF